MKRIILTGNYADTDKEYHFKEGFIETLKSWIFTMRYPSNTDKKQSLKWIMKHLEY